ncbi:MAG: nodulation protein NfeD [Gammaproteobacteria bacterium]|nr:nodulation protein NfeD [Gammaproteobacteria bacterium]NNF62602.1 nodulation protein NfeD [Gammaproteobacteria bacterium]
MNSLRNLHRAFAVSLLLVLLGGLVTGAEEGGGTVTLLTIDGAIGPASSDYVVRGIEEAEENGARLVVLAMDTPGGLDSAMRDIIKAILNSSVPVATYVSPSGSRAASAGTYILYASHVAAMAPATNLGAATPVQIGGSPPAEKPETSDKEEDETNSGSTPEPSTAMERKSINDAVAYIRGLAEMRGRNADWAEQAVREAVSLSAEEAVELNVVDMVADNLGDLLQQLDGRTVEVMGNEVTLATAGLVTERIDPDWRTRLLDSITNPNVAYLLMLIGIYGLLFEGYNPGAIVPGVVGAICLLLALYAFQVLSVNYAGLGLILLGIVLMITEIFVPSFGALGIGGIIAFVIGSIILIDTDVPGFGIDRTLIGTMAVVGGGLTMAIIWFAVRARQMPVVTGQQELIGAIAEAVSDFDGNGTVFVHGENWTANSSDPIRNGDAVKITAVKGLQLDVELHTGGNS